MKRILLLVLAFTAAIGSLSAQNYIVVNSEKVFKSIDEYNKALDTLDQLAKSYQQQVDLKFEEVEALYNNYKAQEMSLSASSRQARQNLILTREEEASKFQEEIFGQDGTLMKKRIELIQPIQKLSLPESTEQFMERLWHISISMAEQHTFLCSRRRTVVQPVLRTCHRQGLPGRFARALHLRILYPYGSQCHILQCMGNHT